MSSASAGHQVISEPLIEELHRKESESPVEGLELIGVEPVEP